MGIAQLMGILAFGAFFAMMIALRGKYRWPLPSDFFLFFMALTWSPLTFFPLNETHVKGYLLPEDAQWGFTLAYVLMCLFIPLGFALGTLYYSERRPKIWRETRNLSLSETLRFRRVVTLLSIGLIALYLTSGDLRSHLSDISSYATSSSIISYNELRREVVREGLIMSSLHPRLQYSVVALLFCSIALAFFQREGARSIAYLALALALFVVCAATLKKRPYLFYFVIFAATYVCFRLSQGMRVKRAFLVACGAALVAPLLMLTLYSIQYRDNSQKSGLASNIETLAFRALEAYPAGFKLYVDVYPDKVPFTYGKSIGLLQPIIGAAEQPYVVVPQRFGEDQTTFPSGYLSYAYSDFGHLGVMAFSILVGFLLKFLNIFIYRRQTTEFRVIATVTIGLSTSYLCNKSFTAALLSGGLLLIPAGIFFLERLVMSRTPRDLIPHRTAN